VRMSAAISVRWVNGPKWVMWGSEMNSAFGSASATSGRDARRLVVLVGARQHQHGDVDRREQVPHTVGHRAGERRRLERGGAAQLDLAVGLLGIDRAEAVIDVRTERVGSNHAERRLGREVLVRGGVRVEARPPAPGADRRAGTPRDRAGGRAAGTRSARTARAVRTGRAVAGGRHEQRGAAHRVPERDQAAVGRDRSAATTASSPQPRQSSAPPAQPLGRVDAP
jgi:hypothetical protein